MAATHKFMQNYHPGRELLYGILSCERVEQWNLHSPYYRESKNETEKRNYQLATDR